MESIPMIQEQVRYKPDIISFFLLLHFMFQML